MNTVADQGRRDRAILRMERRLGAVDNSCQNAQGCAMSCQTMSFALPESMREYLYNRVSAGNYGNTSEYIRDLVRRDQEDQAKNRLRDLIEEGLASGSGRRRTKADEDHHPHGSSSTRPSVLRS